MVGAHISLSTSSLASLHVTASNHQRRTSKLLLILRTPSDSRHGGSCAIKAEQMAPIELLACETIQLILLPGQAVETSSKLFKDHGKRADVKCTRGRAPR